MTAARRPLGWLDGALAAGSAVTAAAVALAQPGALPVAAAALAAVLAGWFAGGRRSLDGGPGWWAFLALLVGASFAGAGAAPPFATFQVVALPLAWMLAPGFRSALAANAAVALAVGLGYAMRAGPGRPRPSPCRASPSPSASRWGPGSPGSSTPARSGRRSWTG